jgi:alkanesulfonate monooxygenase SsuD/methylene tetrahydromethanopterin reductase-like flavin-dependent oxidoreductase (luciferase family)
VRFGLSFPNFGPYAEPNALVSLAEGAEEAGWDGFFVWDHIVVSDGMPVADPWVLLGAIGQATDTIRLGPMVIALPRHRPWVVARQAVTLDRLTGGRVILGVGLGFPPDPEFSTFGDPTDPRVRAAQLDEGLEIITGMWEEGPFQFEGEHYQVRRNRFEPRPVQKPRIPIWVAGMLPNLRPLRRAARYEGVYPIRADMRDMTLEDISSVGSYVGKHRTGTGPFDIVVYGGPDSDVQEMERAGATWYITGPSEGGESLATTLEWIAAGPPV